MPSIYYCYYYYYGLYEISMNLSYSFKKKKKPNQLYTLQKRKLDFDNKGIVSDDAISSENDQE